MNREGNLVAMWIPDRLTPIQTPLVLLLCLLESRGERVSAGAEEGPAFGPVAAGDSIDATAMLDRKETKAHARVPATSSTREARLQRRRRRVSATVH
jgi:hypothetical protein